MTAQSCEGLRTLEEKSEKSVRDVRCRTEAAAIRSLIISSTRVRRPISSSNTYTVKMDNGKWEVTNDVMRWFGRREYMSLVDYC